MERKKVLIVSISALIVVLLVFGIAFAFFTYTLTHGKGELVLGDI